MRLNTKQHQQDVYKAVVEVKSTREAERFLRDLLTPDEIEEFAKRFQIAKWLWQDKGSYAKIAQQLKTSTTTVTRVARFLWQEPYRGYRTILSRLFPR